jgi:hypothetical protein
VYQPIDTPGACRSKLPYRVVTVARCRGQGQRAALPEARRDTVVTAESAWRSALAVRAVGSRRSAASARRWTSTRVSGNAMASSIHMRSRLDRNIHMRSVLPVAASKAARPARGLIGQRADRGRQFAGNGHAARYAFRAGLPAASVLLPAVQRCNRDAGEADVCPAPWCVATVPGRSAIPRRHQVHAGAAHAVPGCGHAWLPLH